MDHLNDLEWSRFLAGDLGFWEGLRLRRHLRACQRCSTQATALEAERKAFVAEPRFGAMVDRLAAAAPVRQTATPAWRRPPLWGAVAFGAAAAIFFLIPHSNDLQAKGGDVFALTIRRGDQTLPFGERCRAADAVRATYVAAGSPAYLMVLGTDGSGAVQQLFPASGTTSSVISGRGTTPGSWVLDAAPGRQCFSAVFSSAPLARQVAESIAKGTPPPEGTRALTRCCEKDGP